MIICVNEHSKATVYAYILIELQHLCLKPLMRRSDATLLSSLGFDIRKYCHILDNI